MKLNAGDYLDGSRYRMETARRLHDQQRYSAAIYLAGVAVECLLRAYILRNDPSFDERHDLGDMLQRSELRDLVSPGEREEVARWLGDVWSRWKNNYRFISDDRLRSHFKKLMHDRGIKGDFLKENSRLVLDSALKLRNVGELRCAKKN